MFIDSIKHKSKKRDHIHSQEESGFENTSPVMRRKTEENKAVYKIQTRRFTMIRISKKLIMMVLLVLNIAMGQDFSGQYSIRSETGVVTLTLQTDGQGGYQGTLSGNANSFLLQGTVNNGLLIGTLGEQGIVFQAQLIDGGLSLIMAETDAYGNLNPATAQTLNFQRQPGENPPTSEPQTRLRSRLSSIIPFFRLNKSRK